MQLLSTELLNDILSSLQAVTFFVCLLALLAWAYYAKLNRELMRYMLVPIAYLFVSGIYYISLALVTSLYLLSPVTVHDIYTILSAGLRLFGYITWLCGALAMIMYYQHRANMAEIKAQQQFAEHETLD
jgi:drug/metabolite transporter (DMT)-like permease